MSTKITTESFIPFLLGGSTFELKNAEEAIAEFFEGPIPQVGDAIELVCYGRSFGNVMMKWRVRK